MLEVRVGYSRSDGGKFPLFLGEKVWRRSSIFQRAERSALHRRNLSTGSEWATRRSVFRTAIRNIRTLTYLNPKANYLEDPQIA